MNCVLHCTMSKHNFCQLTHSLIMNLNGPFRSCPEFLCSGYDSKDFYLLVWTTGLHESEFDLSPSDIRMAFALRAGSTSTELRLWRRMPGFRCFFRPPTTEQLTEHGIPATCIRIHRQKFTWETPLNLNSVEWLSFVFRDILFYSIPAAVVTHRHRSTKQSGREQ